MKTIARANIHRCPPHSASLLASHGHRVAHGCFGVTLTRLAASGGKHFIRYPTPAPRKLRTAE
eukprot:85612-Lingulodinium_polyedra.AAC.1